MLKKVICCITAISFIITAYGCGRKTNDGDKSAASGVNVSIYTASLRDMSNKVTYTGEIKAAQSVSVSAKVNAKVIRVYVKEGDFVVEGQELAAFDATDIQLAYNQAKASYNSALANYNMTRNSTNKRNTAQAKQNLQSAQNAYDSAQRNYNRELELYKQNSSVILAEQSYKDAADAYERAKNLYDNDISITASKNQYQTAKDSFDRYSELYLQGAISQVEYDNAKANMENAKAGFESAELNNKAALDGAYSAMVSAEENLKRTKTTASASLDAAKTALDNAKTSLESAKENISLTSVSNSESIKTAQAAVDSAKAALSIAENNLNNTTVKAPISGYIAFVNMNEGQMISAGMEIFSIKNSNNVDAEIKVTESVIPDISVGTKAYVSIKSAHIEDIEGTVTLVNPVKDERTGMYNVKITISNESNRINVGMFADIDLMTKSQKNAVSIPADAVMQSGEELYVFVADDNTAHKKTIITGIEDDEYIQILSGLSVDDKVIVSGKEYISETNNEINIVSE